MNKKMTDYVIDLVEVLNKQQKQVFWIDQSSTCGLCHLY